MTDDKKLKELLTKAYQDQTFTKQDKEKVFAKIKEAEDENVYTRRSKSYGSLWQHFLPVTLTVLLLIGAGIFSFPFIKNQLSEQNIASPSVENGQNTTGTNPDENDPAATEPEKAPSQDKQPDNTEKENPKKTEGYTSLEALLNDVEGYLNTDIPLVKPTNFPKSEKKYYTAAFNNDVQPYGYSVIIYQTDHPVQLNDRSLNQAEDENILATLKGIKYETPEAALNEVGYQQIPRQNQTVDLGYGLWGVQDAGAGHKYFTWNEGRWYLGMQAQTQDQIDLAGKAKEMVEFLEHNTLPIPNQYARFSVSYGTNDVTNSASWQEGQNLYVVEPNTKDPVEALRVITSITENQ